MNVTSSDRWFVSYRTPERANLRLFCFPHAGGGASFFRLWAAALPPEVHICAVQPPGRENRLREPPAASVDELVSDFIVAVESRLDNPFVFFGHSLGALLAFETTRELRRLGWPLPERLFVSAHPAPQLDRKSVGPGDDAQILDVMRGFGGTSDEVLDHEELLQLLIPVLRADLAVGEGYQYQPDEPLGCPISAFGGLADPVVSREELSAWREQTRSEFTLRLFAGDHFFPSACRGALLRAITEQLGSKL